MTTPQTPLAHFRAELCQAFGRRRDAMFELLDAVHTGERVQSLVRLSLTPSYHRPWTSVFDAVADGTITVLALRRRLLAYLPAPLAAPARELWALDGSGWPRPEAKTSSARTYVRFVAPGIPESGIVDGWEYQWLAANPEDRGS